MKWRGNQFFSFSALFSSLLSFSTCSKRSALFSAFLLLASAFSAFSDSPLSEAEVREWARTATETEKTEALVKLAGNLEELTRLQNEDLKDWTESKKRLTDSIAVLQADLGEARRSSTKAAESFEKSLKEQSQKMTAINSERIAWRIAALALFGGAVGYVIDRGAPGLNGTIAGAIGGCAFGILWWLFEPEP